MNNIDSILLFLYSHFYACLFTAEIYYFLSIICVIGVEFDTCDGNHCDTVGTRVMYGRFTAQDIIHKYICITIGIGNESDT